MKKVTSIAFSPNMKRFAVANFDKIILLFDENFEKKDKIPTKGSDKTGKNYTIKSIEFSPDSTILAVAQSDNMIFGYKIGLEWGEKKSICTKIVTANPITCMIWPRFRQQELNFGTTDGQVSVGFIKTHKSSALYNTESYVCSIAAEKNGKYLVTGHLDCSIYIYNYEGQSYKNLIKAETVPMALSFGKNIVFAGSDGKITFIDKSGNIVQKFDYSKQELRDFSGAFFNSVGETVVLTNYSSFITFNYQNKKQEWEEAGTIKAENYYNITAATWKPDGSKFVTANALGSVDYFDISLKKIKYKGKFELNFISSSKVKIASLDQGIQSVITSQRGLEIGKIEILKDRYVVANTTSTLIVGDLVTNRSSEVNWVNSGNEKFEFGSKDLCWIANAGEISIIEFGINEFIGSFRTEYVKGALISARVKRLKVGESKKYIAYLLDAQTISVLNLATRITEATVEHDQKISSLEFNANASKLLFKDRKKGLFLYNLQTGEKQTLLSYAGFSAWIPESDVIVAQTKGFLNVWYSSDLIDKHQSIPAKGNAIEVRTGKTISVVFADGNIESTIELDDLLIRLCYALENKDLAKCIQILEDRCDRDNEGHWRSLLKIAEEQRNYFIVERCLVALGDIPRAFFVRKINKRVRKLMSEGADRENALKDHLVEADLAFMAGQFARAENIYLQKDDPEKAIEMYQELHRWEDSLRIAEKAKPAEFEELKSSYYGWLVQTGQEEKAAELKEKEGNYEKAIGLYISCGLPVRAANIVIKQNYSANNDLTLKVIEELQRNEMFDKLGEVFFQLGDNSKAINYHMKANNYQKAVEIARVKHPELIVKLEEKWGDLLMAENQKESAINHYVEAKNVKKALDAAISGHQWGRAIQLLPSISQEESKSYCLKIAIQFEANKQYELSEKYYLKAGKPEIVLKMYTSCRKLKEAIRFAEENYPKDQLPDIYVKQGKELEINGKFEEAERLYIETKRPELAIKMYKNQANWDKMLKLFAIHRPENLKEAHILIGRKLDEEEQLVRAERHYLEAGTWTYAVDMYEKRRMIEDCVRVCKNFASDSDTVERAKRWDTIVGENELIAILKRVGLIDVLIDYLSEKKKFEEAFKVAEGARHKVADIHLSYAMYLEDDKKYKEAENHYILSGKFDQAVNMWSDLKDFHAAINLAKMYEPGLIPGVYIAQGNSALENGDYQTMELAYINAKKPDMAINAFSKKGLIQEAIRVAKKHAPNLVKELSSGLLDSNKRLEGLTGEEIVKHGKLWEEGRDWDRAIDCYLECTSDNIDNQNDLVRIWDKAAQLAYNFCRPRYIDSVKIICKRLRDLNNYELAGSYYENIQMNEEAIKCYLAVSNFEKAKSLLLALNEGEKKNELKGLVDQGYKNYLRTKGDAEKLLGNDQISDGLNLMAERGDWLQLLSIAKSKNQELLDKYLLQYLAEALDKGNFSEAITTLTKFGIPRESDLTLFRRLIDETFALCEPSEISGLKTILYEFLNENETSKLNEGIKKELEKALFLTHLLQIKRLYDKHGLFELSCLTSLSLVRYIDLTTIDKPFYEAGMLLKQIRDESQAFMFMNRYLDIYELIEDPKNNQIDESSEFAKADFPAISKLRVPSENIISNKEKLGIRDWLLQISIKKPNELKLQTKSCTACYQEIYVNNVSCPFCNHKSSQCYLTGGPIENGKSVVCKNCKCNFNEHSFKNYKSNFNYCPWCNKNI